MGVVSLENSAFDALEDKVMARHFMSLFRLEVRLVVVEHLIDGSVDDRKVRGLFFFQKHGLAH